MSKVMSKGRGATSNSVDTLSNVKAPKKTNLYSWSSKNHDATLGKYFSELSEHKVLGNTEETESAKTLASLEIKRWTITLREPEIVERMISCIEECLEQDQSIQGLKEFKNLSINISKKFKRTAKITKKMDTKYKKELSSLACILHECDLNRTFITAAHKIILTLIKDTTTKKQKKWISLANEAEKIAAKIRAHKHAFIRANLRLVVSIARRYDRGQMPLIDLIQEGNLGLIKAVERFDYRRGFRFNTYASWWIRHAIGRALADKGQAVRVPVHALDAQQRLGRAVHAITLRLGRTPTEEELIKETGINSRKLKRVQQHRIAPVTSLDKEISSTDNRRYVDLLLDEKTKNPFEGTVLSAWVHSMKQVMEVLTPMERTIIRWRYGLDNMGEEMTLKEIGDFYNLSRERIRQLQEQALKKLRRKLALDAA